MPARSSVWVSVTPHTSARVQRVRATVAMAVDCSAMVAMDSPAAMAATRNWSAMAAMAETGSVVHRVQQVRPERRTRWRAVTEATEEPAPPVETAVPVEPSSATVVMVATVVPEVLAALVARELTAWEQTEVTRARAALVARAERHRAIWSSRATVVSVVTADPVDPVVAVETRSTARMVMAVMVVSVAPLVPVVQVVSARRARTVPRKIEVVVRAETET